MKKIPLTKGKFAIVDDEDFEYLNQWRWYCNAQGYAVREQSLGNCKSMMIRMHRLINKTPKGLDTDHIDRDTLNNRRSNLRAITHAENMQNLSIPKNNTSGHKGVNWHKETRKWRAFIGLKNRQVYLGLFTSIEEAVIARKNAEIKLYAI